MTTPAEKLARVRGPAPEKRPTVRTLSAATAHTDCAFAMLALATGTDLDKLCDGTYFEAPFGQDPQAFQRGEMFERRVKEPAYGTLIQLLRDKVGFPVESVRIENLKSRAPRNTEGLRQRASETKRLLRLIARDPDHAPNIIDGAVLTCTVAGRTAYYEADSLAAASCGRLHVVEVKSFPYTDGRCDEKKLGGACDQAAWYALLARRALADEGLPPETVSDEAYIILAEGVGLHPTLLRQNISDKIRRAEELLRTLPNPEEILARTGEDIRFPGLSVPPEKRLEDLEELLDAVGTSYGPACLQDCGMARKCRARAHDAGSKVVCGSAIVRQLAGIETLPRAQELARGVQANPDERHAAEALQRANAAYSRVLRRGAL
jgi:hypothetical protein